MPARLEISLKDHLADPEGESIRQKAQSYFGVDIARVRTVQILTIDAGLGPEALERIRAEIFTNPVTQVSAYAPLPIDSDWVIWIGYRPGVRDNPGATAVDAIQDLLGVRLAADEAVYTSKRYCLSAPGLTAAVVQRIAGELLANDIIQQWRVFSAGEWDPSRGVGLIIPKVRIDHTPTVSAVAIDSDAALPVSYTHLTLPTILLV